MGLGYCYHGANVSPTFFLCLFKTEGQCGVQFGCRVNLS